jgi:hypothetical protein
MKIKNNICLLIMGILFLFAGAPVNAQNQSQEDLLREVRKLKEKTRQLEEEVKKLQEEKGEDDDMESGDNVQVDGLVGFIQGLRLSGSIELETFYEHTKPEKGLSDKTSDIDLSTVELVVDVKIDKRFSSRFVFDYEEGRSVTVDDALIHFQATDICEPDLRLDSNWYASAGKMDIPFGYYESHLLSDPLTQDLGEAKEMAFVLGMYYEPFNIAVSAFNGEMDEFDSSDHIASYVATARFAFEVFDDFEFKTGASYISNIADSDELTIFLTDYLTPETHEVDAEREADEADSDQTVSEGNEEAVEFNGLKRYLPGIGSFCSISYKERIIVMFEYVGAQKRLAEDRRFKPEAWNLEVAFVPVEDIEVALGYGETKAALDFLPKKQVGITGVYDISDHVSIGLEGLRKEMRNKDKVTLTTAQLAVSF